MARRQRDDAKKSGETVALSQREERDVARRLPPTAAVVFETIRREGEHELDRPVLSLAASGLAAGLSMGFSLVAAGVARSMLPAAPWRPLIENLGYTVGFLIVVMGRQQLFTENTLTAILPLLDDPDKRSAFIRVARLWTIVLLANLAGAMIFAWAVSHPGIFPSNAYPAFAELAHEAARPSFGQILERGVFAGWLIALMVWLMPAADSQRPAIIVILTYIVGVAGLSHVIAGTVDVFYLVAIGQLSFAAYLGGFLLPVFLGNCIGGVSLVALLNYGQVVSEGQDDRK